MGKLSLVAFKTEDNSAKELRDKYGWMGNGRFGCGKIGHGGRLEIVLSTSRSNEGEGELEHPTVACTHLFERIQVRR